MKSPTVSPGISLSPAPVTEDEADVLVNMKELEAEAKDVSSVCTTFGGVGSKSIHCHYYIAFHVYTISTL